MNKESRRPNPNIAHERQVNNTETEIRPTSPSENRKENNNMERLSHNTESNHDSLDSVREAVELHSTKAEGIRHLSEEEEENLAHKRSHTYITKDIKAGAYQEVLTSVRTKLTSYESRFSKLIHNNAVENISEFGAKTIARPILLLGGGLFMVIGGVILLVLSRYFGFELPLSIFLVLYLIGFLAFGSIDIVISMLRKRSLARKSNN